MKKRDWHLYLAAFYRNDAGWRFTLWERVDFTTNENWYFFYLSWRVRAFTIGTVNYKRGIGCDFCGGSATE
jgi:hypothetical protein